MKLIKELNTENTTKIKTDHGTTEEIPVASGIRQGDSLSPILFNLIMDKIINSVDWRMSATGLETRRQK